MCYHQQTKAEVNMKSQLSSIKPDIRENYKTLLLFYFFGKCNYFLNIWFYVNM